MTSPAPRWRGPVVLGLSLGLAALLGVGLIVFGLLRPDGEPDPVVDESGVVSRTTSDGTLVCTARLASSSVAVGDKVPLKITIANLSDRTQTVPGGVSGMKILDPSGVTVFDSAESEAGFLGPPIMDEVLEAGETLTPLARSIVRVEWPSYVVVLPTCPLFRDPLPSLRLDVSVEGEAPQDPIRSALKRTHGLLKKCPPGLDGSERRGVINIPGAKKVPSMRARCSASATEYPGFAVVEFTIVSPPDAPEFELPRFITVIPPLPGTDSFQAVRWRFVVSSSGVKEVEGLNGVHHTSPPPLRASVFEFFDGAWHRERTRCGGTGSGPGILIISACPP
jgi:hypothetical protein